MTVDEFSNQFDVQVSAYAKTLNVTANSLESLQNILHFDEYEKSVFLTKAQEIFVIQVYSGRNLSGSSFEVTEEDRKALSSIVRTQRITPQDSISMVPISKNSYFFRIPSNVLFVTYESCEFDSDDICISNKDVQVIPVTQDEFHRTKNNPFRGHSDNRVLRLDAGKNIVELVSKNKIKSYIIRYVSKPYPIILTDLGVDLSIDGLQSISECQLPDFTHNRILDIAVNLALQSRLINQNNK